MHAQYKRLRVLLAIVAIAIAVAGFNVQPAEATGSSEVWICNNDLSDSNASRTWYTPFGTYYTTGNFNNGGCVSFVDSFVLDGDYNFTQALASGSPLQSIQCYHTDYENNTTKTYSLSTRSLGLHIDAFDVYDFCVWTTQ